MKLVKSSDDSYYAMKSTGTTPNCLASTLGIKRDHFDGAVKMATIGRDAKRPIKCHARASLSHANSPSLTALLLSSCSSSRSFTSGFLQTPPHSVAFAFR